MTSMRKITPCFYDQVCTILIGHAIVASALKSLPLENQHTIVFVDKNIAPFGKQIVNILLAQKCRVDVVEIEVSEALKDFSKLCPLYTRLLELRANRHSFLIAVGGGVLGDVIGFVASTYMRGTRWIGIPTTLLAQVDSSIGGKTGVNHEVAKNVIGTIYQPWAVISDTSFLRTLHMREMISGLGEIIKYGCAYDERFFQEIQTKWSEIIQHKNAEIQDIVAFCIEKKISIVQSDTFDRNGLRATLNFGHTVAHALEKVTCYEYFRHGEAVILGMRAAVYLSYLQGHLPKQKYLQVNCFLEKLPIPSIPQETNRKIILDAIGMDKKKSSQNQTQFVLLKDIGQTILDDCVSDKHLNRALDILCETSL